MSGRSMHEDDPLDDFAAREITLDGLGKRVYVMGRGPAGGRPDSWRRR